MQILFIGSGAFIVGLGGGGFYLQNRRISSCILLASPPSFFIEKVLLIQATVFRRMSFLGAVREYHSALSSCGPAFGHASRNVRISQSSQDLTVSLSLACLRQYLLWKVFGEFLCFVVCSCFSIIDTKSSLYIRICVYMVYVYGKMCSCNFYV